MNKFISDGIDVNRGKKLKKYWVLGKKVFQCSALSIAFIFVLQIINNSIYPLGAILLKKMVVQVNEMDSKIYVSIILLVFIYILQLIFNSFVEQVDIYEQEQPDGRFLKHIKFRFPVYFGERETQELCWDNESTVEIVCLLGNRKPDTTVKLSVDMDDYHSIINGKDEEWWFHYSDCVEFLFFKSFTLIMYLILE